MPQITKPYPDFVNDVDVVDADKVNAQINTLYAAINGGLGGDNLLSDTVTIDNLATAAYATSAKAKTLGQRDANGNIGVTNVTGAIGQNLIFNPLGALGLAGWTASPGSDSWSTVFDEDGMHFTSPSITASGTYHTLQTTVNVGANIALTLTGDIYTKLLTGGTGYLSVHAYDSSNNDLGLSISGNSVNAGSDWSTVSIQFTTPPNTSYIKVWPGVSSSATSGRASFRKLKLESGSVATAFSDDATLNTEQYGSLLLPSSLSASGYQKLPNGFIIQWDRPNVTSGNNYNYPITFPHSCLQVVASPHTSGPHGVSAVSASASSVTLYHDAGGTAYVTYFAIGY